MSLSVVFFNSYEFAKGTSFGSVQWVSRQGGAGTGDVTTSVTTDIYGNVYIAGYYGNTLTAYNADGSSFGTTLAIATSTDCFLIKYDQSGNVQWVTRQTSAGATDQTNSVTTDPNGNVYIAGQYSANMTVYNANGTATVATLLIATSTDCFLIKYDSTGTAQWVTRQTSAGVSDSTSGVTTDSSGNVYIAGYYSANMTVYNANGTATVPTILIATSTDCFLVKYDSSGTAQWVARQTSAGAGDQTTTVTTDVNGNVYIAGYYTNTFTAWSSNGVAFGTTLALVISSDSFLIKYDSTGIVQWVTRQTSASNQEVTYGVATDSSGNVYITGQYGNTLTAWNSNVTSFGTTLPLAVLTDCYLIKYNSSGTVQWVTRQAGPGNGDSATDVFTDSFGNVYMTGDFNSTTFTAYNADTTAFSTNLIFSGGASDSFLIKYDTNGNVLWVAKQTGPNGNEISNSVNVDYLGNVYIAGSYSANPMTAYNSDGTPFKTTIALTTGTDCFLIKYGTNTPTIPYSADGRVSWVARQASIGNDVAYTVTTDSSGNVYVAGSYGNTLTAYNADASAFGTTLAIATSTDCFLIKYDQSGNVQWVTRQTSAGATDQTNSVTTDSNGNVYIAGRYSANMTVYNADGTATVATLLIATSLDCFLIKYDSSGTAQWVTRQTSTGNDVTNGVTTDSSGNVYIAGYYSAALTPYNSDGNIGASALPIATSTDCFLIKYNSSGTVQWTTRQTSGGASDITYGVTTDSSGNVYIAGRYSATLTAYNYNGTAFGTTLGVATSVDCFLIKYDTNGTCQWVTRQTSAGSGDITNSVTTDSFGNVYIAGQYTAALTVWNANLTSFLTVLAIGTSSDCFLIKYDSSGTVQWVTRQTSAGTGDATNSVTTDSFGNVYISGQYSAALTVWNANVTAFGTTLPIGTSTDCFVIKYDSSGTVQWVARQAGTGNSDISNGITVDSNGNVYTCGQYNSNPLTAYNADTTAYGVTLPNAGGTDCFLIKYGSNKPPTVQWVAPQVGTGTDNISVRVVNDSTGNVYVAGVYNGSSLTAYNADGSAFGSTLTQYSDYESFLVKYSPSGSVQWITKQTNFANGFINGLGVDSSGGVYIAGQFDYEIQPYNADGTSFGVLGSFLDTSSVLVKYNSSGSVQWMTKQEYASGSYKLASDSAGNVFITGQYYNAILTAYSAGSPGFTTAFGTTLPSPGAAYGSFLIKYNSSGAVQWVARQNGTDSDVGRGLAIDSTGAVYVAVQFVSTALTAYNATGTAFASTMVNGGSSYNSGLIKYTSLGAVSWAAKITSTGNIFIFDLDVDKSDNVYVTGYCDSTSSVYNFNGTVGATLTNTSGTNDSFLVKYNSTGTVQWAARQAGAGGDIGQWVSLDSSNGVYIGGQADGNSTNFTAYNANGTVFGTTLYMSGSSNDAFVAKYDINGNVLWVAKQGGSTDDVCYSVSGDIYGSVYACGKYTSTNFNVYNPDGTSFGVMIAPTYSNGFLVKYA